MSENQPSIKRDKSNVPELDQIFYARMTLFINRRKIKAVDLYIFLYLYKKSNKWINNYIKQSDKSQKNINNPTLIDSLFGKF